MDYLFDPANYKKCKTGLATQVVCWGRRIVSVAHYDSSRCISGMVLITCMTCFAAYSVIFSFSAGASGCCNSVLLFC